MRHIIIGRIPQIATQDNLCHMHLYRSLYCVVLFGKSSFAELEWCFVEWNQIMRGKLSLVQTEWNRVKFVIDSNINRQPIKPLHKLNTKDDNRLQICSELMYAVYEYKYIVRVVMCSNSIPEPDAIAWVPMRCSCWSMCILCLQFCISYLGKKKTLYGLGESLRFFHRW